MTARLLILTLVFISGTSVADDEFSDLIEQHAGVANDVVAYDNVRLIDLASGHVREGMTIVVNGERIAAIAESGTTSEDVDRTVNANGWYALPGLVDTHVHLATLPDREGTEAILNRHVFGGVTTVRDMAGDVRALSDLSRSALLNQINAPDIHYSALMAGPSFFTDPRTHLSALGRTPGGLPWMRAVSAQTDLQLAVAEAKGSGASGIKIYANLDAKTVHGIVSEAAAQDLRVWTHAKVFPATPLQTIASGATAVSHVCMLADHALHPERTEYQRPSTLETSLDYAAITAWHPRIAEVIDAMVANNTYFDATLSVYDMRDKRNSSENNPNDHCSFELGASITGAAAKAGVRIVTGTDVVAGPDDELPSLLHEIEILVSAAGLSNVDALRAATINGAMMLGVDEDAGSLEVGNYASIVFTSENPLANVSNLRTVRLTLKRGVAFPRDEYVHLEIPEQ